jgi:hypothetical protein
MDDEYDSRWEKLPTDISHLDPLHCTQCERGVFAGEWIHVTETQNVILCRTCAPPGGRPIALRDDD